MKNIPLSETVKTVFCLFVGNIIAALILGALTSEQPQRICLIAGYFSTMFGMTYEAFRLINNWFYRRQKDRDHGISPARRKAFGLAQKTQRLLDAKKTE